ncbi:MAG: response regulator [Geminicoccaceae bacterium]|nr:response regulator [Geminicoccaceae bacterium]MCB9942074.1 response regulator [Geminicoccaceae bacterium]
MIEFSVRGKGPVYLVDDDKFYQMIIQRVYQSSRLANPLECYDSGIACLEALERTVGMRESVPSLVLLDVNMPVLSGIETVRRIRARKEFAEIPVVTMLSSSNDQCDIEAALSAGASGYCEKPVDIKVLKFVAMPVG